MLLLSDADCIPSDLLKLVNPPPTTESETNEDHVKDSRSIFVTPVEHHEGVRLAKEVLLVQLVGAELQGGTVLRGAQRRLRNLVTQQ